MPGCEFAGITRGHSGSFSSAAKTSELVCQVDEIQYELGTGPCVDAVAASAMVTVDDLRTDCRWPTFGIRAFEKTGMPSMLSFRLFVEDEHQVIAALNLYARTESAFTMPPATFEVVSRFCARGLKSSFDYRY